MEHASFYLGVLTDCIKRMPVGDLDWRDSWKLQGVDEAKWAETKQTLRDACQTTLEDMKSLEKWEGEDDVGASLAILAHTASHLGAIRQAIHFAEALGD
ncbi:hypothetical protein ACFLSW_04085 [Candidatus Bipolaricaulota bacterium]